MRRLLPLAWLLIAPAALAGDFSPRDFNLYLSAGKSPMDFHGHSIFRTITFEFAGQSKLAKRWLRSNSGISVSYSDIHQARSWFGYRYGDPNDWVRAVSSFFFVRRPWHHTYAELGTGPMWSNRRVPAATSRFNMDSQLGIGLTFAHVRAGYHFSHISNGGVASRNPGLNVHSVFVGTRFFGFTSSAGRR